MRSALRHPIWPALAFALASSWARAEPVACARLFLLDEQELITHALPAMELSERPSEARRSVQGRSRSMSVELAGARFDARSDEAEAVLSLSLIRLEGLGDEAAPEAVTPQAGPPHAFSSAIGPSLTGAPVRIRADGIAVELAHSDRFSLRAAAAPGPCPAESGASGPRPAQTLRKPPAPPPFL